MYSSSHIESSNKTKVNEYMHEKLEKNFNDNVVLPDLEEKKKYLKQLKHYFKPMSKTDFEKHEKSYQEIKQKMQSTYILLIWDNVTNESYRKV